MILCLGTTPTVQRVMTFARVQIDEVNRAREAIESASGKSINVARVLTTLGEKCLATGLLGGTGGQTIRRDLDRSRVPHDFLQTKAPTRLCVTVIDQSAGTATELIEESHPAELEAWPRLREKIERHLSKATLLVMSGSLPPGAPQNLYAWCIERARQHKVETIVDASGEALRLALEARPMLVKPNRAELAGAVQMAVDDPQQLRAAMHRLHEMGARFVVVTLGADGAMLSDAKQTWHVRAPEVNVISPIGSGDALAAGLAAGIARGLELPEALRLGVACATANAETPVPAMLTKERVEDVLAGVEIRAL